ncbi:SDR family NAD(P)-dependent oxidoreductase [bacterium endosymbiont of Pedicinus badii]|uniref:SDR family NAD(P)-dependent oxidoreductase n=1 Tax=bacterium endosymbiont of Pedicinus badii TaxID=1719126 RepID=UPI0009BBBD4A|nr:SDR family NAD(P)-dependent oxidoreductase [bacterium endosymbiont of Pedicinus badii]OQM34406.1 hypothetical protein AOQ89_00760 [bacterium endosymbiont of Pedicinus badii]
MLKNKNILITGANRGIGKQAAITYSKHGANVILVGKRKKSLMEVKKKLDKYKTKSEVICFDLNCFEKNKYVSFIKKVKKNFSCLDGLLNNASILGSLKKIQNQRFYNIKKVFIVNFFSVFIITKYLIPVLLKSKNSSVVFTTSNATQKIKKKWAIYAISKISTEGIMKAFVSEFLKNKNIRFNCINPGRVATGMRKKAYPKEKSKKKLKKTNQIMNKYLYLMSEESKKENGKIFLA